MKVYDRVKKVELDLTNKDLINMMVNEDRQVDLVLNAPKTDADGYLTWDAENWVALDAKRFVRSYFLQGRALNDSTRHNIYDMAGYFLPEEAKEVILG